MGGWLETVPKAELHVHLEGSLRPATLCELVPGLTEEDVTARYRHADFAGFIDSFKWVVGHLKEPGHFALAARRLLEELAAQRVTYAEITLSVGVMLLRKQDAAAIYDAVVGEAARSKVDVRWVVDAVRQWGAEAAMEVARFAAERSTDRIVGFGIGGDEAGGPVEWFRDVFAFARENGLALVPHAGETVGAESVWGAVKLGARRIGHGIRAVDDPTLMHYLRDHDIPLEVCISSNVATGAVAGLADHPVRRLYEAGVPIVLNSDDPAMFNTTLTREYEIAASHFGFSEDELRGLVDNSFRYARVLNRP
ncbi:MAG: adenosine deaminase [Bryobacterales bacterium]|nr:adenosine deaminase [Bryobacterales bacterium]